MRVEAELARTMAAAGLERPKGLEGGGVIGDWGFL
jgi:hypothetical protein